MLHLVEGTVWLAVVQEVELLIPVDAQRDVECKLSEWPISYRMAQHIDKPLKHCSTDVRAHIFVSCSLSTFTDISLHQALNDDGIQAFSNCWAKKPEAVWSVLSLKLVAPVFWYAQSGLPILASLSHDFFAAVATATALHQTIALAKLSLKDPCRDLLDQTRKASALLVK